MLRRHGGERTRRPSMRQSEGGNQLLLLGGAIIAAAGIGVALASARAPAAQNRDHIPLSLLYYPGAELQSLYVQEFNVPPLEEGWVMVLVMLGTAADVNDVLAHFKETLGSGATVAPSTRPDGMLFRVYPPRAPGDPPGRTSFVEVGRGAKSDLDPRDGYSKAGGPEHAETKITLVLVRKVEKP